MWRYLVLSLAFLSSDPAAGDSDFHGAKLISVYDGDTFTVDLGSVYPAVFRKISVRIKGIDTAELDSGCRDARRAKDFTFSLLHGQYISLRNCARDKYFRLLCDVKAGSVDLSRALLTEKLAVAYDGRTKPRWICRE